MFNKFVKVIAIRDAPIVDSRQFGNVFKLIIKEIYLKFYPHSDPKICYPER